MISQCSNSISTFHLPNHPSSPTQLQRFFITPPPSSTLISPSTLPRIHSSTGKDHAWRNAKHQDRDKGGGGERHVDCVVDVISWRERRIQASIVVSANVDTVWGVLTDYERLADFIPNLVYSGTVPCPHKGRIWLEQRGLQRALYWHIEARVILDLQEFPNSVNGHELHFSMVDGDFKRFDGKWSIRAIPRSSNTNLLYEVNVIPRFNFPAMFIERIINSDLPSNLQALAFRAEGIQKSRPTGNSNSAIVKASSFSSQMTSVSSLEFNKVPVDDLKKSFADPEGHENAALPTPPLTELDSNWGIFGKVCSLDRPSMVDEVHLRRFDGLLENGGFHHCVIASITVKAPAREVWNMLTSYERLPEIVPNLAISKVLLRENNKVRILQEGCKCLLYMVLHARIILDLHEQIEQEITFKQVEGDFDSFHGKWILEKLGNHHTLLKYAIETKLCKDALLSEAIVEEVIYEDLPSNLCAIRDFVEKEETLKSKISAPKSAGDDVHSREVLPHKVVTTSNPLKLSKQRPKVPGLHRDIEVLKSELLSFISKHGQEGFMPMRKQLRLHGRVDIEKAIARKGGFRKIANLMNLSLAYKYRKPKGYWDNLENLHQEITDFQRNWGMDPTYMPSRKSFERAGRFDIARALEKWGGLHEVSRLLSLKLRHSRRQNSTAEKKTDSGSSTDFSSQEKIDKANNAYVSHDPEKWLLKLKDLDINWLE